tara:strand:- start:83 stop:289 length:207 start_codon:yes stop_codon:yes gene_type:complete
MKMEKYNTDICMGLSFIIMGIFGLSIAIITYGWGLKIEIILMFIFGGVWSIIGIVILVGSLIKRVGGG